MAFPGWTWEHVDREVTLPQLAAIHRHWRRKPPVHWMVAGFLGVKPQEEPTPESAEQAAAGLVGMLESMVASGRMLDG